MRVTQGMISQNSLRNISKSYEKLSKINEQAQTGDVSQKHLMILLQQ